MKTTKSFKVKFFCFLLAATLLSADLFAYSSVVCATESHTKQRNSTEVKRSRNMAESITATENLEEPEVSPLPTDLPSDTEKPQETEKPAQTEKPQETEKPVQTEKPQETEKPVQTNKPQKSPKPEKKVSLLKAVSGVRLARYTTNSVKVTWKKHKKAKYYRVYYGKKNGKAKLAGTTKNSHYIVKKLKNKTKYYFYVVALASKKPSGRKSHPSKKVSIKTRNYTHKTVFAGDSICQAVGYGQAFPQMHIPGKKKVVAYRGLNTVTFHTKRIFNGKTGLQKLISEKPYRVYMMIGMNEIHYRKTSDMIAEYKAMLQQIKKSCPDTDIVLCAVSPVTRAERARHSGYWQIPVFNRKLKKLAKKMGLHYFDYTAFLKDSSGYLKAQYAEGDGYHWKASAYTEFGKIVNKYEKSLDK